LTPSLVTGGYADRLHVFPRMRQCQASALYVRKSSDDSDGTYGYRRVHRDLAEWGVQAGPELVRSLMRELGLEACQPRPWRVSLTEGDGQSHDIPDRRISSS
jgi:putative transposase